MVDIFFDGQKVHWNGHGTYLASSGMPDLQHPNQQCTEGGPVPEGLWYFVTKYDRKTAQLKGDGTCDLKPSNLIQDVPMTWDLDDLCRTYFENWGNHRVRLEPYDERTKKACGGSRSGFYLHDSRKGYSHGCIELEASFFLELRTWINLEKHHRRSVPDKLILKVEYFPNRRTSYLGDGQ